MNRETPKTFYITTAIDYPNSAPHMGHAYEKVVADFYARAYRLLGRDTRFLIGLDEHGQKIQEAAQIAGMTPQAFVDDKARLFNELYDFLEVSRDDFIRTSEPRHHEFARWIYDRVKERGDIYKGVYKADYCISCERPLTLSDLVDGKCPIHDRPTTQIEEESYFFRLGKYREPVRAHIASHPDFVVPEERRNEVLSRLEGEVYDLSISRSTFDWGVQLPDDPSHVLYVWFDALSNYMSALTAPEELRERFWPADCHVIGKDILWFHTVIWPAMLLSAGIDLPRQVYVHGFILDKNGRKMAKHLGNVVDPLAVARDYSVDVLRYYLLRAFSSAQDGRFSIDELAERYEKELGNDLGNLVRRTAKLAVTRAGGELAPPGEPEALSHEQIIEEYFACVDRREHHRALDALWGFIRSTNAYLNTRAPWKMKDETEVRAVLYETVEALRTILHLLFPVMPAKVSTAARGLGFDVGAVRDLERGVASYKVELAETLFPRREEARPTRKGRESPERPASEKGKGAHGPVDPFAKLDLKVGRIETVEPHPDADSLYAMTVDIGSEQRSICAGLREHVPLEELEGRTVLVLANLKPAKLRGIESRGMILASDTRDGRVVPVDPGEARPGDPVTVGQIESRPKAKLSKSEFEKAPLTVEAGRVTYRGKPLRSPSGDIRCDAEDGAAVR